MNLKKKKILAERALKIGKERIKFLSPRLDEIKEAITKKDIKDLVKSGAIIIKNKSGRRKLFSKKRRKEIGKIKRSIKNGKKNYIILTRKLRKYIYELKKQGRISKNEFIEIRKKIRNKVYKSKSHLKEQLKIFEEK